MCVDVSVCARACKCKRVCEDLHVNACALGLLGNPFQKTAVSTKDFFLCYCIDYLFFITWGNNLIMMFVYHCCIVLISLEE